MPAHMHSLTHTSEQIPIAQGQLVLGTWQEIYIWEHRQVTLEIVVHIVGKTNREQGRGMRIFCTRSPLLSSSPPLPLCSLSRRMKRARE